MAYSEINRVLKAIAVRLNTKCVHDGGKQQFLSLGRLDRKDVRKKMDEMYKEAKLKEYVKKVDNCTFSDLMELWYLDVVPRLLYN